MRKSSLLVATMTLMLTLPSCQEAAKPVAVYPVPQSVEWGEKALNTSKGYQLVGAQTADEDAVRVLGESLNISENGVQITIGERGDESVSAYGNLIPNQKEGYYLSIDDSGIVIAGNDESGTFYGVQTLLQIASKQSATHVKITDYPSVVERGMIEGYYGNPLSYEDRVSQFEFYGKNKMNVYIYGPKDDPFHGFSDRWREFYPAEQAKNLASLATEAAKNKVQFVWAVHPGNNINWNEADRIATVKKLESVYDLGVRSFAVFFDDISGEGTNPTKQVEYLNYLQNEFVNKKGDVAPLIFCPTQYNQSWTKGDYLDILGNQLDPQVRIMWTGKKVCHMIDDETMEWVNARIKRKAYIWLNYPVTDYVIDHLLMGPFVGNSQNIASQLGGFVSNPMEYGEASKVALFGIADYAWNMKDFDAQASWLASLKHIMPENTEAFKVFCENNVDIGVSYHGLRMPGESQQFADEAAAFMDGFAINKYDQAKSQALYQRLESFRVAAKELRQSTYNPSMTKEITPWLDVFDLISQQGQLLLNMQMHLSLGDSVAFVNDYLKAQELKAKQMAVRSRDFEGSIKRPNPKAANEVVAPFFAKLENDMLNFYRENYDYRIADLPIEVIKEGRYYIKVGGKYLTNQKDSKSPVLVVGEDNINPQRQEWIVTKDHMLNRYKITNAQDGKYISSQFAFTDREFNQLWHTFQLHKHGDNYAIQNGGYAGEAFINIVNGKPTHQKDASVERVAKFEFVPISQ